MAFKMKPVNSVIAFKSLFINFTQKVSNLVVEPCLLELKLFRPSEHEKWKLKFSRHIILNKFIYYMFIIYIISNNIIYII
jgi:hypothetical protein